jgi:hypothetical protein
MEAHLPYQTQEQQQRVVELWASSGLTQAEFCRRENIPQWKLSTWKRCKIRAASGPAPIKKRNSRASRKKRTLAQTANLQKDWIAKQSASGLSAAEFCTKNEIALKNFTAGSKSTVSKYHHGRLRPAPSSSCSPQIHLFLYVSCQKRCGRK